MVSNSLHNYHENSFWTIWQTSIGSLVCFCCVVFLGLKLKWFRAQLKFGDTSNQNKSSPVQGVGFKLKSNPDDFQLYKVTSEFATPINQKQIYQSNENIDNKKPPVTIRPITDNSTYLNKLKTNLESNFNTSTSSVVDSKIHTLKIQDSPQINIVQSNHKTVEVKNVEVKKLQIQQQKEETIPQTILKKQEDKKSRNKNSSVNFDPTPIEITNPKAMKFSDLINNPKKENEYEIEINKNQEPIQNTKQSLQIKNPLASQNFLMPRESEDEWKIKIVEEKPKTQRKNSLEIEENVSYFTGSASTYSSQAASIFFGGQTPVIQPRARKFMEMEEDNISTGSQTSA